jgi:NADPH:quinone reductase-like Zn-dependent oxidoreductase
MKAVGYSKSLPITDIESLTDIELPQPIATGHDLLVKVRAVAVNPVDYKIRQNVSPGEGEQKVLGWDAVGEVVATGEVASQFTPGDVVYYADDLNRQGSNAENLRTAHEKLESGRSIGKIVLQGFHAD